MTTTVQALGRRERKKAATRTAIADAALRLFLERGYDQVTVREIADLADVSSTTVIKHFATKEALVFDRDAEIEAALIESVTNRPVDVPLLAALRAYMQARVLRIADEKGDGFRRLVRETPALSEYSDKMWMRHQHALAQAITDEMGRPSDDPGCAALACFTLETAVVAARSKDPLRAVAAAFDILEHGWSPCRSLNER